MRNPAQDEKKLWPRINNFYTDFPKFHRLYQKSQQSAALRPMINKSDRQPGGEDCDRARQRPGATLSVIFPAYNEEANIRETVELARQVLPKLARTWEISSSSMTAARMRPRLFATSLRRRAILDPTDTALSTKALLGGPPLPRVNRLDRTA
jgi:hypothetical protein